MPTVFGTIVLAAVWIYCALLDSLVDLKAAEMDMECSLIWELMLHKFELGHKAAEATKNICCVKSEGAIDHSIVTRGFKKFHSGCKNLENQAELGRPKTMDSKSVLEAIEKTLVNSTLRLSGELGITQSSVICHIHDQGKSIWSC